MFKRRNGTPRLSRIGMVRPAPGVPDSRWPPVIAALLCATLPAGATDTPATNNVILGGGSQAAYATLNRLDFSLFNLSPGRCPIFVPQPPPQSVPSNSTCPASTARRHPPPTREPLTTTWRPKKPLGSGSGILQLEEFRGARVHRQEQRHRDQRLPGRQLRPPRPDRPGRPTSRTELNFVACAEHGSAGSTSRQWPGPRPRRPGQLLAT